MLIHELGHFLVAKRVGITVEEFSIGFGPEIASFKRGGTAYSIRLLPFFSYVRMLGSQPGESAEEGSFNSKGVLARMAVVGAGPFMYFMLATLLFAGLFTFVGVARPTTVVQEVLPGYPADRAGIKSGDRVLNIAGTTVVDWDSVVRIIYQNPGKILPITVERNGQRVTFNVIPARNPDDPTKGFVGIRPAMVVVKQNPLSAVVSGVVQTFTVIGVWIKGLVMVVTRKVEADVVGPVGIIQMIGQASRMGVANMVSLAAVMSASLGAMNMIPFPALDGGRLLFLLVEAIRGRPMDPEKESLVHLVGFAILLLLALVVTYKDILRIAT